jgi:antitoxin (DNA-binding transcriptional repressor) of toxin-antitoxin stability system
MRASVIDLRNKMSKIIKALDRNEKVTLVYHGKEKAVIEPIRNNTSIKTKDHPFFGMNRETTISVNEEMKSLRDGRFNDL